jgi:hypothetical protein
MLLPLKAPIGIRCIFFEHQVPQVGLVEINVEVDHMLSPRSLYLAVERVACFVESRNGNCHPHFWHAVVMVTCSSRHLHYVNVNECLFQLATEGMRLVTANNGRGNGRKRWLLLMECFTLTILWRRLYSHR